MPPSHPKANFAEKIARYAPFSETIIRPNPRGSSNPAEQAAGEAERVLRAIPAGSWVVALDERGASAGGSERFALQLVAAAGDRGTPLTFLIGGPYGHGPAARERADQLLSLSDLVLNHQVSEL